jgi:serine phosphatase RsbU (regulator of sigma subunit)
VRFGVARALQIIRSEREKPAREIIETLHNEVLGFCRNQMPADDITIVIAKMTGE